MLVMDTFRVKRNTADYTGEEVDEASVEACITSVAVPRLALHLNTPVQPD